MVREKGEGGESKGWKHFPPSPSPIPVKKEEGRGREE